MSKGKRGTDGTQAGSQGQGKGGGSPERAIEVMAAVRLAIALWELIRDVIRDDHWLEGGPGRLL
jgi:hypothetical protein